MQELKQKKYRGSIKGTSIPVSAPGVDLNKVEDLWKETVRKTAELLGVSEEEAAEILSQTHVRQQHQDVMEEDSVDSILNELRAFSRSSIDHSLSEMSAWIGRAYFLKVMHKLMHEDGGGDGNLMNMFKMFMDHQQQLETVKSQHQIKLEELKKEHDIEIEALKNELIRWREERTKQETTEALEKLTDVLDELKDAASKKSFKDIEELASYVDRAYELASKLTGIEKDKLLELSGKGPSAIDKIKGVIDAVVTGLFGEERAAALVSYLKEREKTAQQHATMKGEIERRIEAQRRILEQTYEQRIKELEQKLHERDELVKKLSEELKRGVKTRTENNEGSVVTEENKEEKTDTEDKKADTKTEKAETETENTEGKTEDIESILSGKKYIYDFSADELNTLIRAAGSKTKAFHLLRERGIKGISRLFDVAG
ncbi:MAG: hypothetical protein OCU22_03795 [Canidatus Methanoxibalbensis ujae]|nr:hypothetical protein [Candidatus Methanoxibalbensis ujae]